MQKMRPFLCALVVDEDLRLVQEAGKARLDPELLTGRPRVIFSSSAPAVENRTLPVKFANVLDHLPDWRSIFAATFADEGIIDIDVHIKWIGHMLTVRFAPPFRMLPSVQERPRASKTRSPREP
jgi:hypothetical protein